MNKITQIICLLVVILFWPKMSSAYQINTVAGTAVSGDYVVGQGKNEINLNPGEEKVQDIYIINRSGKDLNFLVSVVDFSGTSQAPEAIKFTSDKLNLYPAKTWLLPEISKFTLKQGEKITLPVMVRVAKETAPGGLYGAVMITTAANANESASQVKPTASLASLFFVRVNGDINEAGSLQNFSSVKSFYQKGPVELFINFKNTGNIYLNPHGAITITNLWGKPVYQKEILPYFVLPGATRQVKEVWQPANNWGVYRATIELSRGYGSFIDRQSIQIYIFSWFNLGVIGLVLLGIVLLIIGAVLKYKKR